MTMTYDHSSARAITRRISAIAQRVKNPDVIWPKIGKYMSREVGKQFSSHGAYFGRPWKPLKPGYRLWKVRAGYGRKILVRSGEMKGSWSMLEMGSNFMVFGSRNQKAVWHQDGTHEDGKRINPPRPMLVMTPTLRKGVKDQLAFYVLGEK